MRTQQKAEARSKKLSDLLNIKESEIYAETKKEEALKELKQIVKELQDEDLTKRQKRCVFRKNVGKGRFGS